MSRKAFLRSTAIAATAVVVAGLGFVSLQPAQAAVLGSVSLNPATGGIDTLINLNTSGPCSAPAIKVRAIAVGFGFPASGQIIYSPQTVGFSTTNPMTLSASNAFRIYATNNSSTPLVGAYDIKVQCVNSIGNTVLDEYTTVMNWTTPGNSFANIDNATYEARPSTTTTLAPSLTSPQLAGTAINLTATVDAGAVDPSAGSVQFFNGATSLGTSTVGAGGIATLAGVTLPVGAASLTAVFAANPSYQGSTSSAVSFAIDPIPATATTTTLAPITTPIEQGQTATFNATVLPNNSVGKVEFYNGATKLGETPLASGTAAFSTSGLGIGSASIKAKFVPTNVADFTGSESAPQTLVVNAPSVGFNEELINVDVPAGALTISVLGDRTVTLPAVLDADGSRYTATGSMDDVSVVDTRAGSPGWVASGQLTPFKQGAANSISAANLGWAPSVVSTLSPATVVTPGATVAPAAGVAIGAGAGSGLSVSRTLASSAAGSSTGTAVVDATLNVVAPTTTLPGIHTAVLTFTAI